MEGTMANQAKEARARLEASFRKQHEADALLRRTKPSATPKQAVNVTDPRREAARLTRKAVGRAAGAKNISADQKVAPRGHWAAGLVHHSKRELLRLKTIGSSS